MKKNYRISADFKFSRDITLTGNLRNISNKFPLKLKNTRRSLRLKMNLINKTKLIRYHSIIVHSPDSPPLNVNKNEYIDFDGGREIRILINPKIITIDDDLKNFHYEDRQCYLDGEKILRFYKKYSVKNCNVECYANFTFNVCGCVPFDVVRNDDMRICGLESYDCLLNAKSHMMKFKSENYSSCKCYQNCNSITYDYEIIEKMLG